MTMSIAKVSEQSTCPVFAVMVIVEKVSEPRTSAVSDDSILNSSESEENHAYVGPVLSTVHCTVHDPRVTAGFVMISAGCPIVYVYEGANAAANVVSVHGGCSSKIKLTNL